MRFIWELGDITNGRIVVCKGVRFVIGYVVGSPGTREEKRSITKRCLIDLRDGAVLREYTLDDLAKHLTDGDFVPEKFEYIEA